jgi:hypothetical protein
MSEPIRGTIREVVGVEKIAEVGESYRVKLSLECEHVLEGLLKKSIFDAVDAASDGGKKLTFVPGMPQEIHCRHCHMGAVLSGTVCERCRGVGRVVRRFFVLNQVGPAEHVEKCPVCEGEGAKARNAGAQA